MGAYMHNQVNARRGFPTHPRLLVAACVVAMGTAAVFVGPFGVAGASARDRAHGRGNHRSHLALGGVRRHHRSHHHRWGHREFAAAGVVQGAPSGESFTIETHGGATDTVVVSSSTTYSEPGVSSPTLSNVESGDRVVVFGTVSGSTITATHVLIFVWSWGVH
jgi:hypothetical protein